MRHELVLNVFKCLVDSGEYVLHGNNVKQALQCLEPRQANDAAKRSGNNLAVYASLDIDAVLFHAVLDKAYLSKRFDSYTVGYRSHEDKLLIKLTDNIYQLFKQKDPHLFSDGHVYAMNRENFIYSPDSTTEFFAFQSIEPEKTFKVSGSLGNFLFRIGTSDGNDTVIPYSAEETIMLATHRTSR